MKIRRIFKRLLSLLLSIIMSISLAGCSSSSEKPQSSDRVPHKKNLIIKNNVSFGEGKIVHLISRLLKLEATNVLLLDEPLNHLSFKNSRVLNELLREEIQLNPNLVIIMVSHCRAMDFTEKAMVYDLESKSIHFKTYKSYECFAIDEYSIDACSSMCV